MSRQAPPPQGIDEIGTELRAIFSQLAKELRTQISAEVDTEPAVQPPEPQPHAPDPAMYLDMEWEGLMTDLPASPPIAPESWTNIFKLAKELKRRAALMTAGRDLHGIHTILHLAAHWNSLDFVIRSYTAHRMRLLYTAVTKGWQAALYYDQQGSDEFLDVSPEFWTAFQPTRSRAAQRRQPPAQRRSPTRRARGKTQA